MSISLLDSTENRIDSPQMPPRCNVLGVGISAMNYDHALQVIDRWISHREAHYVTVTGVHGVMESQRDPKLRDIFNRAGLVTPDGMPMVWLCRAAGHKECSRVYGPELMLRQCEHSIEKGYRHFFYGGAEGVAEQLATTLGKRFPGLQVAGSYCPPFRPLTEEEDREVCRQINDTKPDIVWVGLSTPKQERWMAAHVGKLNCPVMLGVGAAFDFHTGRVKQAPRWMQDAGLEWLFRLTQEPKRLWKRYLVNNPLFVTSLLLTRLGLRELPSIQCTDPTAVDHSLSKPKRQAG